MASRIWRTQWRSSRILVAIKSIEEVPSIIKLLFSRIIQRDDYVLFLHVAQAPESWIVVLDEAIYKAMESLDCLVSEVTVSSLVVGSSEACDSIIGEARRMRATMVILGNSRTRLLSRSMHRFGKQCVRSLPCYCSVLIVRRGKVMLARTGSATCEDHTLRALLVKQKELEVVGMRDLDCTDTNSLPSSSCSMDTILSFSTDGPRTNSDSPTSEPVSPSSVLPDTSETSKSSKIMTRVTSGGMQLDTVRRFRYEELVLATDNFASENLIGCGGCCSVYRGMLEDGSVVAVKRLLDSSSGQREFTREIKVISYIQHPNLLSLVGFCSEESLRLLVYPFLPSGSLQQRLHDGGGLKRLSWKERQVIALGAARGLRHLHELSPHHVIHQDVKSSNILLSKSLEAQLSDFGFAKWSNELTITGSGLFGTFGYMAPEYLVHGTPSERTDVYSFGVVLLELISGRSSIDSTLPTKQQSLALWASVLEKKGETYRMVDSELEDIDSHEMKRMMYTALLCVRSQAEERPDMTKVVELLDMDVVCNEALLSRHS